LGWLIPGRSSARASARARIETIHGIHAIRAMLDSGKLPPPANDARCKECSLKEICQPEVLAERHRLKSLREELFNLTTSVQATV